MQILFLDQSGQLGGAELCLADIAQYFQKDCLVGLFEAGSFSDYLNQRNIPVSILAHEPLQVKKDSNLWAGIKSLNRLIPLANQVAQLSQRYDLIYANTQKALVIGSIASFLSQKPLIFHLHDIVSADHFSAMNRRLIVSFANRADLIIANSVASLNEFVRVGGRRDLIHVVYNSFCPNVYKHYANYKTKLDQEQISTGDSHSDRASPFIVGHFSRLSPWKGQHVLIDALQYCSDNVVVWLVGDALFGEDDYVQQLHNQVKALNLAHRVKFLGFRTDVPQLMAACDLVAHTSIAPEPFGRVIVEAMLCGRPVVAAAAGGALEIVEHGHTGWLSAPEDARQLGEVVMRVCQQPEMAGAIARQGQISVQQRFHPDKINHKKRYTNTDFNS